MAKVNPLTIRDDLTAMVAEGLTLAAIGERLHVRASTVAYHIKRHNIPFIPAWRKRAASFDRKHGKGSYARLIALFEAKTPMRDIGATFGFSFQRAHQLRKEWEQGQRRKTVPTPPVAPIVVPAVSPLAQERAQHKARSKALARARKLGLKGDQAVAYMLQHAS